MLLAGCTLIARFDSDSLRAGDGGAGDGGAEAEGEGAAEGEAEGDTDGGRRPPDCLRQRCTSPGGDDVACLSCEPVTDCECDEDADCPCLAPNWAVCDRGRCGECLEDRHCAENPGSFGPHCLSFACACESEAECDGNPNGPRCTPGPSHSVCGCTVDDDCPPGRRCTDLAGGLRVCFGPR
jgi:hypothetical protein